MSVRGLHIPTPGVTYFACSREEFETSRDKFAVAAGDFGLRVGPALASCTDLAEVEPLLTWIHERCHYEQVTSTPFGRACWQVDVAASDLAILGAKAGVSRGTPSLEIVNQFSRALLRDEELTMRQFVTLANEAHAAVASYWGAPYVHWTAHDLSASSYLPQGLTTIEVLEGSARVAEYALFAQSGDGVQESLFTAWWVAGMFGDYEKVATMLVGGIGNAIACQSIARQALMGDAFLRPRDGRTRTIAVEDVLPPWRLTRLVEEAQIVLFPNDDLEMLHYCNSGLIQRAGLEFPGESMNSIISETEALTPPVGPGKSDVFDVEFRRFSLSRFIESLKMRTNGVYIENLLEWRGNDPATKRKSADTQIGRMHGFQSILEIYPDSVAANKVLNATNPMLTLKCYAELVRNSLGGAILDGSWDLRSLRGLDDHLAATLYDTDLLFGRGFDVPSLTRDLLGIELSRHVVF